MLTKDLVQATVRNGRLFPKFIKANDPNAESEAELVCALYADAKGRIISDLEDDAKRAVATPRSRGFAKLLMDRCEVTEPDDEIMELRWRAFAKSEALRTKKDLTHDEFVSGIADELGQDIAVLREQLFSDLPSSRLIENYDPLTPEELLAKYNLSHITTFLCFADSVAITVANITLAQKRELMRRLKFNRLMTEVAVDHEAKSITLELSGPLRLFGKAQGYAIRIANFFPFVASLPEWKLESVISWKGKKTIFSVDQSSGVKTKYSRSDGGYIPKEFEQVMENINAGGDLKIKAGDDFVHLGKQSYCFPDFNVEVGPRVFGVELFHPWHKGQLRQRIEAASRMNFDGLLIGVERSLLKDPEIKSLADTNSWYQKFCFEFSQFPTPNVIKRAVAKHG